MFIMAPTSEPLGSISVHQCLIFEIPVFIVSFYIRLGHSNGDCTP